MIESIKISGKRYTTIRFKDKYQINIEGNDLRLSKMYWKEGKLLGDHIFGLRLWPNTWDTYGLLYYFNPWGANIGRGIKGYFFHKSKFYRDLIHKN